MFQYHSDKIDLEIKEQENGSLTTSCYFSYTTNEVLMKSPLIQEQYEPLQVEVLIESYFDVNPICTIAEGNWLRTRLIYSDLHNYSLEHIYKRRVVAKDENVSTSYYTVKEYTSGKEMMREIVEQNKHKAPEQESFCQSFFSTLHILRYRFQHIEDKDLQLQLHLCCQKNTEGYFNYGKIKVNRKCNISEMRELLGQINSSLYVQSTFPIMTIIQGDHLKEPMFKSALSEQPLTLEHAKFNTEELKYTLEEVSDD